MVLALDLDETLIHCTRDRHKIDYGRGRFMELYVNGKLRRYWVYRRPYLDIFLYTVSMLYEIVVFTAGEKSYVANLHGV